jgi:hypothetical protein
LSRGPRAAGRGPRCRPHRPRSGTPVRSR